MEAIKKIVSILIPSYNCGKVIYRLLDSILIQTYPYVEVIIIDDGSTDNTREVIDSYRLKFEVKNYPLKYVYQDNSGQSAAINNGLKLVNGDFIAWPDADDFYSVKWAIEKMVNVLSQDQQTGICYCYANIFDGEKNINRISYTNKNKTIFLDSIFGRNGFYFQPVCYMAKTSFLFQLIPDREIYYSKDAGQNWQLMLPLFYATNCVEISEYLANIYARTDSHSRGTYLDIEKKARLLNAYYDTVRTVVQNIVMSFEEKKELLKEIDYIFPNRLLKHYWETKDFSNFQKTYRHYSNIHTTKNKWNFFVSHIPFFRRIQFSDYRIRRLLPFLNLNR